MLTSPLLAQLGRCSGMNSRSIVVKLIRLHLGVRSGDNIAQSFFLQGDAHFTSSLQK
jgi:hypothetical protein